MKDRLRFGVIGCGAISIESHFPALLRSRRAKLEAAVDSDLGWAQTTARRFGAGFAGARYQELPGRIDAAIVATPNATHSEISRFLLEHGIHVLCEKPMATTAAEAKRMLMTAQTHSSRLMIGQSLRFSPQVQFLQKLLHGGFLDKSGTLSISLGHASNSWNSRTDFRLKRELSGGGVMMDLGVHLIDIALCLFDSRPISVEYAQSYTRDGMLEDDAEVRLDFADYGRSLLAVSYTRPMNGLIEYRGNDGWVKSGLHGGSLDFYIRRSQMCRRDGVQQPVLGFPDSYFAQLEHFCSALRSGEPFLVRTDQVILGLEIIEACYAHEGRFNMEAE